MSKLSSKQLLEKWDGELNNDKYAPITSNYKKFVTATLLENASEALASGEIDHSAKILGESALMEDAPNTNTANVKNYDPVLVSMIRRSAPNLVGFDLAGVIPLTGPTGTIFALRSRYASNTGAEAFYNEANTGFSTAGQGGNTAIVGDAGLNLGSDVSGNSALYNYAGGMTTIQGEAIGSTGNVAIPKMTLTIEKFNVEAKTRALQADYSTEMAQDLKAIHGMEAERELSNILATELLAAINREIIRCIAVTAVPGSQTNVTTAGTFDLDTDSNGRWMGERFAGLHFHITREANAVAKSTRRGRGNVMICSSDVASALEMAKILNVPDGAGLQVDDTGNVFAGTIGGRIRVFIDPYAGRDFFVLGYKGSHAWDAGLYYSPYTPLQLARGQDDGSFQPKLAYKTRYAVSQNPFSRGLTVSDGTLVANSNVYYRRTLVNNIM